MIQKVFKKLFTVLVVVVVGCWPVSAQSTYKTYTPQDVGFDSSLTSKPTEFALPKSILLVPIAIPRQESSMDSLEFYKGLYYYQVTRFDLPALTFHYFITNEGELIQNEYSNTDRKIQISDNQIQDPIIVGYIANPGDLGFDSVVLPRVSDILLDLANRNSVPPDKIFVKSLKFEQNANREFKIGLEDVFVGWQNDLQLIVTDIAPRYTPVARTYKVDLLDVSVPDSEIDPLKKFSIKLKIKNSSNYPIYGGTESEMILSQKSSNDEPSKFFLNNEWASKTQVRLMQPSDVLLAGEEKEYEVGFLTPFEFGDVIENFEITTSTGTVLSSQFEVRAKVKKPDGDIVEITDTGAGYLRVRKEPNINADEVTRVSVGEKYIVIEQQSGWYKIQIDENTAGWVLGKYAKIL